MLYIYHEKKHTSLERVESGQNDSGTGQNPVGTLFLVLGLTNIIFLVVYQAVGSPSHGGGVSLSEARDTPL